MVGFGMVWYSIGMGWYTMLYHAIHGLVYNGNWSHKRSASHDSVIPHSRNKFTNKKISQQVSDILEKSLRTRITFGIEFVFAQCTYPVYLLKYQIFIFSFSLSVVPTNMLATSSHITIVIAKLYVIVIVIAKLFVIVILVIPFPFLSVPLRPGLRARRQLPHHVRHLHLHVDQVCPHLSHRH